MDGSNFAPNRAVPLEFPPRQEPGPLPDREWSLTAVQVTGVVLAIIAVCELIGWMS